MVDQADLQNLDVDYSTDGVGNINGGLSRVAEPRYWLFSRMMEVDIFDGYCSG